MAIGVVGLQLLQVITIRVLIKWFRFSLTDALLWSILTALLMIFIRTY